MQFFSFTVTASILAALVAAAPLPQGEVPTPTFSGIPSGLPTGIPSGAPPSAFPSGDFPIPTGVFPSGFPSGGPPAPTGGFPSGFPIISGPAPTGAAPTSSAAFVAQAFGTGSGLPVATDVPIPSGIPSGAIPSGIFPSGIASPAPTGGHGHHNGGHRGGY